MPQDKKLTNKDYISGKGDYMDKYSGTVGEMDPEGFMSFGKRNSRVDAAGRNAEREMNDTYAMNKRGDIGMLKQLSNSVSAAKNAEKVALAKGMKTEDAMVYGSNAARNSRPNLSKVPPAKPVSAAAGAKMISAMAGKSYGTFKGGTPRSALSSMLKIK